MVHFLIKHLKKNKGLTLIEVLFGLLLLGLVVGITYSFYTSGYAYFRSGSNTFDVMKNIRFVKDYMTQELRYADNVAVISQPEGNETILVELARSWINSFEPSLDQIEDYYFFYVDEMGLFKHVKIDPPEADFDYEGYIITDIDVDNITDNVFIEIVNGLPDKRFTLVENIPFSNIAKNSLSFNISGPLLTYTIKDSHDDNLNISSTLRLLNYKDTLPTSHYAEGYLFKEGEEEIVVWDYGCEEGDVDRYKDNNLLYLYANATATATYGDTAYVTVDPDAPTDAPINLTGVKNIEVDWENTGHSDEVRNKSYLIVSSEHDGDHEEFEVFNSGPDQVEFRKEQKGSFGRRKDQLPLDNLDLSNDYFIRVHAVSIDDPSAPDVISELKVYNIRLIYDKYTAVIYRSP